MRGSLNDLSHNTALFADRAISDRIYASMDSVLTLCLSEE